MTQEEILSKMVNYMEEGREFRENVIAHMAKTTVTLENASTHGERITKLETSHSNIRAVAASWIAAVPFISAGVSWVVGLMSKHT